MSEGENRFNSQPSIFNPPDEYTGCAFLFNGRNKTHVVYTNSFGNGRVTVNEDGTPYEGYSANIGRANTLCGRILTGRMVPLDTNHYVPECTICSTCLRSLRTRTALEADDA